jgi:DNA repair exonuclease SbcCD ATPase subunit
MLDGFKKQGRSAREQADDLESLIATSREERAALTMMLSQIQLHGAKVAAAGRTLQEVDERSAAAERRLDEIMRRMTQVDSRTNDVEALEMRLRTLGDAVTEAERAFEARAQALNAEVAEIRTLASRLAQDVRALQNSITETGKDSSPSPEASVAPASRNVDTLRSHVDAIAVQVTDARRKLEGVSAIQARLLPLRAQLTSLKSQIEKGQITPPRLSS